ncbi:MAG: glycosyltransferase family 2 protein [Vicinamibacterales bacterium]|nr:glycosyltransferase family 2 protein [Vicinamibacterales bacterium]
MPTPLLPTPLLPASVRLSIVIVSYNTRTDLERCLRSLRDTPAAIALDVVVVDNASGDGSADWVRANCPSVRLIEAGANLGFARANNLGIRATASELVLLLNPDTVVPPGAIDRMVGVLDSHPGVSALGPRLIDAGGNPELSWGAMIGPAAEWRQKRLMRGLAARDATALAEVDRLSREERVVDWVSGACLLVRRAAADAVGLLDERFFMYTEDVDFCASLRARGGQIRFTPAAEVIHLRGRSAATAPAATHARYRQSQVAFYRKHHPRWVPLLRLYFALRGVRVS